MKEEPSPRARKEPKVRTDIKSTLFVNYTTEGGLAKLLREQIKRLEPMIGFGIKVIERTGRPIMSYFR